MIDRSSLRAAALVAGVCWFQSVYGHHSAAAFDMRTDLIVEGTVVEFKWQNPHAFLTLETTDADGRKTLQEVEAAGASLLAPRGLSEATIRRGEHVVVLARPSRRGPGHTVLGVRLTNDDGQAFTLHLSDPRTTVRTSNARATSIAGRWVSRQADFFAYRDATLQRWPRTEAVRAAQERARGTARTQCTPYGPPALMIEPVLTTIAVSNSAVTLSHDLDGSTVERVVHLDVTEHPRDLAPSFLGHSIGTFEQGVLVIDSVGFTAQPEGFGYGVPSSERKHLVERLSLTSDGALLYETTIEDPETLTETVSVTAHLDYRPELSPAGTPCDLESAREYLNER
jgi:uncharacterized protein DUF6152